MSRQKLIYAAALWLPVLAGKWWYQSATVTKLGFILNPLRHLVSWLTGHCFILTTNGYLSDYGYLISRNCSGFNFWLIAFLSLGFLAGKHYNYRWWLFAITLPLSYGLMQLANTSRIICLLTAQQFTKVPEALHLAIGTLVYLTILLGAYAIINQHYKQSVYVNPA